MQSVEDFIKYASPQIDFIEDAQAYLDATRYAPHNMYGMEKDAAWLKPIGQAVSGFFRNNIVGQTAASTFSNMITKPMGSTVSALGKWMIKRPELARMGGRVLNPGNLDKWTGKLGMRLAKFGLGMQRAGKHADIRLLNRLGHLTGDAAKNLGFWGKTLNGAKGILPGALGFGGFTAGVMGVPGFKQLTDLSNYTTGYGLVNSGINWAGDKISQGIGSIKEKAMQGAEDAAMRTAAEMANGIYEQGRLGHMYGAIDPEGFRSRLLEQAQQGIRDKFTQLRGGATV